MLFPNASHDPKSHVAYHINHLDSRMQWFFLQCHQHHVMLTLKPMASHGPNADTNCVTWSKCHIGPHFYHLHVRNGMLSLIVPSASHDAGDVVKGNMTKRWCWTSISIILTYAVQWCHWWYWQHHVLPTQMWMVSHDTNTDASSMMRFQWCHITKKLCCTSFWSSWANTCSHATDSAISITMPKHQQMPHLTKKDMLHLIVNAFTKEMQWCHWWCHWHHMVLLLMPVPSHHHKCHLASHFDHLDLMTTVVPLVTLGIISHQHKHQSNHMIESYIAFAVILT